MFIVVSYSMQCDGQSSNKKIFHFIKTPHGSGRTKEGITARPEKSAQNIKYLTEPRGNQRLLFSSNSRVHLLWINYLASSRWTRSVVEPSFSPEPRCHYYYGRRLPGVVACCYFPRRFCCPLLLLLPILLLVPSCCFQRCQYY